MRKKLFYSSLVLIFMIIIFLNMKGARYTGYNYSIQKEELSNFKKIKEFYDRYFNYKKLVSEITYDLKEERDQILQISRWVYLNINKKKNNELIVDSHPWTIAERKIGAKDQFSDLLSVLLVMNDNDSFFKSKINNFGPLTFFKFENKWSVIDPYYGIYFLNDNNQFCNLAEQKLNKCNIFHLVFEEITDEETDKIFFDKNFNSYGEIKEYYFSIFKLLPSKKDIENINIYSRGGRSYIQKPIHRLIYQIRKQFGLT